MAPKFRHNVRFSLRELGGAEMNCRRLSICAAIAYLGSFISAGAQSPAAAPEPEWSVSEVVVKLPAPRMWKLVSGASTVWVLGIVTPLPKGLKWNTAALIHAMDGAKRIILPPMTTVGPFEALEAVSRAHLPKGKTLDTELPPDVDSEYRSVLSRLGRDPAKYQNEKPAWAALMLDVDVANFSPGFDPAEPTATIRRLARERHVPTSQATYKSGAMLDQLVSLPDDEGRAVLSDAVRGADFALAHQQAAGQAWAQGRLQMVRANVSPASSASGLLLHTPAYQASTARSVDDAVKTINQALAEQGTTVVVMSLTSLARLGGALDVLKKQGVTMIEPVE
jgi:uncharacterized protein YbaP (TraB family)